MFGSKKHNQQVVEFTAKIVANEIRKGDLQRGYENVQTAAKDARNDMSAMTPAQRLQYLRSLNS